VSSSVQDWGAYGKGTLTVQSGSGEVLSLHHDYFAGETTLQFHNNGLTISGTWHGYPGIVGDPRPAPVPVGGTVELDPSGRPKKISGAIMLGFDASTLEYTY
jgi:hypothetical protein